MALKSLLIFFYTELKFICQLKYPVASHAGCTVMKLNYFSAWLSAWFDLPCLALF